MSNLEIIEYMALIFIIGFVVFLIAIFLSGKVIDVYFKKKLKFWKDWGSEITKEEKKNGEDENMG